MQNFALKTQTFEFSQYCKYICPNFNLLAQGLMEEGIKQKEHGLNSRSVG